MSEVSEMSEVEGDLLGLGKVIRWITRQRQYPTGATGHS